MNDSRNQLCTVAIQQLTYQLHKAINSMKLHDIAIFHANNGLYLLEYLSITVNSFVCGLSAVFNVITFDLCDCVFLVQFRRFVLCFGSVLPGSGELFSFLTIHSWSYDSLEH